MSSRNPCTARLLSEAAAYADQLTDQGVVRSTALRHASQRFGFTTKQIMSASGRARIDPDNELADICADEHLATALVIEGVDNDLARALA